MLDRCVYVIEGTRTRKRQAQEIGDGRMTRKVRNKQEETQEAYGKATTSDDERASELDGETTF